MKTHKAICHVTHVAASGKGAFALREDNGEGVFISSKAAKALRLEECDTICAVLIRSSHANPTCPWFSVTAVVLEDDL